VCWGGLGCTIIPHLDSATTSLPSHWGGEDRSESLARGRAGVKQVVTVASSQNACHRLEGKTDNRQKVGSALG
jgi:hypothetical protein